MATDFFDQQDAARRQTARLIALFLVAVVLIVLAVYAVATLIAMNASGGPTGGPAPAPALFDPARFALVATLVLLVITTGSLYKISVLRDGGAAIASMLGGRLI